MRRLSVLAFGLALLAAGAILVAPHLTAAIDDAESPPEADGLPLADLPVDPAGEQLLLTALAKLEQRGSMTARIRHQAHFGNREFFGQGTYRQQGRGENRKVKWLLESQRDGLAATLLQVSDGRYLWTDRRLPSGRRIDRVDLWQLRRKFGTAVPNRQQLAPGQASWAPIHPDLSTSFGGVAMLLGSLRDCFDFTAPQLFSMGATPVYAVIGRWRPDVLADLMAAETGASENRRSADEVLNSLTLPERLPHHVLVLVGRDDAFPYVVEYRGRARDLGADLTDLFQPAELPLARLEFTEVQFDAPIDNREFDYDPPVDPDWTDNTASFLRRLDRARELQLGRETSGEIANRPDAGPR